MSCIQFADDTTLFYADKSLDVIKCCVENDLESSFYGSYNLSFKL